MSKVKSQLSKVQSKSRGFTLIELLIVMCIIVVLVSLAVVAINPALQLKTARDNQRKTHINALYGALSDYRARKGDFPACVTVLARNVEDCAVALVPDYLESIPQDSVEGCAYFVKKSPAGRIGLKAGCAEAQSKITVGDWVE